MKILIACEFSGIVRDAFTALGHDATSCDLLPTEKPGKHYQGDVFDILNDGWDMMIAHPPCPFLCVSANKWYKINPERYFQRIEAAKFFIQLATAPIEKICIENPIGVMSGFYRKPDQIIQPWQFGHAETKATCLWLKGLNPLEHSNVVALSEKESERMRLHYLPPSEDRWKERSRTFPGIANAMASQWGGEVNSKLLKAV